MIKESLLDEVEDRIVFNVCEDELKKSIVLFNKLLFKNRRDIYSDKDTSELYKESISITTDILFILLAKQRGLNDLESCSNMDSVVKLLKVKVSRLGNNNVTKENWSSRVNSNLYNLVKLFNGNVVQTEVLSILVEDTWEKNEDSNVASKNGSSKNRRTNGSYYTNNVLTEIIVNNTIDPLCLNRSINEILQLKIIDPAVGSGAFLKEALNRLLYHIELNYTGHFSSAVRVRFKRKIVESCLYGVDINSNALKAASYSLWLEVGDKELSIDIIKAKIIEGDSLIASHWDIKDLHLDVSALNLTNYYVAGNLFNGKKIENWFEKYSQIFGLESNISRLGLDKEIIMLGKSLKTFIWQIEFQDVYEENGGFDAVVGNPPWNKVKSHMKEFFEHYDVNIKGMQGEDLKNYIRQNFLSDDYFNNLWTEHNEYFKRYSDAINNSPHFEYQTWHVNGVRTGGDRDLYKYFVELAFRLTRNKGFVGFIVPGAIIQSQGTTGIRELLFNHNQIELLMTVENRDSIFPIDSRFKYAFLVFRKVKSSTGTIKCRFMLESIKEVIECLSNNKLLEVSKELINTLSPDYKTIPDLKTQYEIELLEKVYESHPLINSPEGWKIQFHRELDMTNDSKLFIHTQLLDKETELKAKYIPLYEGRMVHQFDFAAKAYLSGEGRQAKWKDLEWDAKEIIPHFYVKNLDAEVKFQDYINARPGYCDIAGQTNERAVQTALLPQGVIAGNKVPTIKIKPNNIANNLIWIAITNSFVFDWLMRLRISTTINFFHWNQLPLPRVDEHSDEGKQLVRISAKLSLVTPLMNDVRKDVVEFYQGLFTLDDIKPSADQKERQELRAQLDALVSKIYGLSAADLAYVLFQFPLLDRKQPGLPDDKSLKSKRKSSFITRDKVLYEFLELEKKDKSIDIVELYRECQLNIDDITGGIRLLNERIKKAEDLDAVAYIPG